MIKEASINNRLNIIKYIFNYLKSSNNINFNQYINYALEISVGCISVEYINVIEDDYKKCDNISKYLIDNGGNLFHDNNKILLNCFCNDIKLIEYFSDINNIKLDEYNFDNISNKSIEEFSNNDILCGLLNGDLSVKITLYQKNNNN